MSSPIGPMRASVGIRTVRADGVDLDPASVLDVKGGAMSRAVGDDGIPFYRLVPLNLSTGLHFGATDTYTIDQIAPAAGTPPGEAIFAGQDAPSGDAVAGGGVTIRGGAPGDTEHRRGDVEVDLGNEDVNTLQTASLALRADGVRSLEFFLANSSEVYALAGTGKSLTLTSDTAVVISSSVYSFGMYPTQTSLDVPKFVLTRVPIVQEPGQITTSGSITIDFAHSAQGPKVEVILNGATTLANPSNVEKGARYQVKIVQSATYAVTWGSNWKFGGTSSTVTSGSGAIDIFEFEGDTGGIVRLISASKGVHA